MTRDPDQSVMPDPWFRARSSPTMIMAGFVDNSVRSARSDLQERQLGTFILPPFQRQRVWTPDQNIEFIESIWNGIPIGNYVVNRYLERQGNYALDGWLLDGQQRWTAIYDYMAGGFPVLGYRFPDLPRIDQTAFTRRNFTVLETCLATAAECEIVYKRLAYGGTPHARPEPEDEAVLVP